MKLFLAALLISTSAIANTELFRCTGSTFSDLQEIVLYETSKNNFIVTEIADDGSVTTISQVLNDVLDTQRLKLSDWNGYKRNLFHTGDDVYLEYGDECSGGSVKLTCTFDGL